LRRNPGDRANLRRRSAGSRLRYRLSRSDAGSRCRLPGSYEWLKQGLRRYGFHGISHQHCAARAAEILNRDLKDLRLVTCHLGNGCSLAAIRAGRSVYTTMGFTPPEGLMMGSRSGSIDPGLILHLLRQPNYRVDELDRVLNEESGLDCVLGS
jgi:acetate kinase